MKPVKKQTGAILAFTLMMLLLMTIAGVNMISQNKMDLLTAGSSREQTQALATVEAQLAIAEAVIDSKRYASAADKTAKLCLATTTATSANQIDPGDMLVNAAPLTSQVKNVACLTAGLTEETCTYVSGERDLTVNACYKLYNIDNSFGCRSEIYTLTTTATMSNGAVRKIESKYGVDCTGNGS